MTLVHTKPHLSAAKVRISMLQRTRFKRDAYKLWCTRTPEHTLRYQNVELHNIADTVEQDGQPGFTTTRYPAAILPEINPGARNNAAHGSGCEVRGMLPPDGEARITLQTTDTNVVPPVVTVYHGSFSGQAIHVGPDPVTITIKPPDRFDVMQQISAQQSLPFDPRLARVCFPPIHPVRVLSIEGDLTYPPDDATPDRALLCYGSSITHGAHAISPRGTYAAQCAWRLGYDLINLGVGGSARMDAAIADHIAARDDWDVATFEMGINVRDWPVEQFHETTAHFVQTVAAARPDKPIFCIDLFTYFGDFETPPDHATRFRDVVRQIVDETDGANVHYVDGRTILDDPTGLQTDMVHPNDNGMLKMGHALANVIRNTIG